MGICALRADRMQLPVSDLAFLGRWSLLVFLLLGLLAIRGRADEPSGATVFRGAHVLGLGVIDFAIEDGKIVATGEGARAENEENLEGLFVVPAFIDSHVHLAYFPAEKRLSRAGVAAVVDLGAPVGFLERIGDGRVLSRSRIKVLAAGPMITAVKGYPTQSWGRGGYGREVSDSREAEKAVSELHAAGARLLKLPLTDAPVLGEEILRAAVKKAKSLGMKVACHALTDEQASRAAKIGADLLAHTPVQPLKDETVDAWKGRAVISTLLAFRAESVAAENLSRLRKAGSTILYGTDLGNTRTPAIDGQEIALLVEAGFDAEAIVESATRTAAEYWGFQDLGSIEKGKAASFLVFDADPREDPGHLARPAQVYLDGVQVR